MEEAKNSGPLPRRLLDRAALAIGALLLALVLAEALARAWPPGGPYRRLAAREQFLSLTRNDPVFGLGFVPRADALWDCTGLERQEVVIHFRTVPIPGLGRLGMRDDPMDPASPVRILALGDSFTFGFGVERKDIWCERIEARHPGLDLANLGLPGGAVKAAMLYEAMGPGLSHDGVIYEMWLGNEFWDNWVAAEIREGWAPGPPPTENNLVELTLSERLALESRLYFRLTLLTDRVEELLGRREEEPSPEINRWKLERMGWQDPRYGNFLVLPHNMLGLSYCLPGYGPEVEKGIEETKRSLLAMKKTADKLAHGRFAVFLFPFKEQVYFDLIKDHTAPGVQPDLPNRIVLDFCREQGIQCIDLLPGLIEDRAEPLFWDYDPHFRPRGHEAAAALIERYLIEAGWIAPVSRAPRGP